MSDVSKLKAEVVSYSSIVSSSILLKDEKGIVIAQIAIMTPNPMIPKDKIKEFQTSISARVVALWNGDKDA